MRLIDADALIKALVRKEPLNICAGVVIAECMEEVRHTPTIEPERKKGKWIQFPNHMAYKCSECGRVIQTTDGRRNVSKHYPFCHCGADMRGDQNEAD